MGSPIATLSQWSGTRVWREEVEKLKLVRSNNETVYDTLESYYTDKTKFDTEIEMEIYTGTRATGVLYWSGVFSISDSDIDQEFKVFEIKPRVNDDYYEISNQYDVQYELDIARSILQDNRIGYSVATALSSSWTNGGDPGGITGEGSATGFATLIAVGGSIATAIAQQTLFSEATHILTTIGTGDIVVLEVTAKGEAIDFQFDIIDSAVNSITTEGRRTIAAPGLLAWTSTERDVNPSILMISDPGTTEDMEFNMRIIDVVDDHDNTSQLLMDFLEDFITDALFMNLTGYAGEVVSTFILNDALPTGAPSSISTFMGSNPNGNYVDETSTNKLNTTTIGLLRYWFTDSVAKSYKLSFKEVTDFLRDILQLYWFIDDDGKFRFEHEKYFIALVDDSTPITVPAIAEIDKRQLKYEKSGIASVEQFSWPQAANTDFIGNDIVYNDFSTTVVSKALSISQVTTDIKYVMDNLDEASDSGLGLYHCNLLTGIDGNDIYEIVISTGALSASAFSNAVFSWANLHQDYWTYSRMSEDATMNGTAVTMDSAVRFLQQGGVRWYYATAIDPYTAITTTLTGGAPIEIKRDLETDYIEMIIGYDPYKL